MIVAALWASACGVDTIPAYTLIVSNIAPEDVLIEVSGAKVYDSRTGEDFMPNEGAILAPRGSDRQVSPDVFMVTDGTGNPDGDARVKVFTRSCRLIGTVMVGAGFHRLIVEPTTVRVEGWDEGVDIAPTLGFVPERC